MPTVHRRGLLQKKGNNIQNFEWQKSPSARIKGEEVTYESQDEEEAFLFLDNIRVK